jgi:GT2 family glycosyltransferase
MTHRMTDASTPLMAEESTTEASASAPKIKVVVTLVEGADLEAALATVDRQVYDSVEEVIVVGDSGLEVPDGIGRSVTLEEAIASTSSDVEYLWILHSDARPRPDALAALVSEVERNDASLGGSKLLVAGTRDELESIGSATDVFGEPYSGLDEGEIDLQQYDVVREVAFVSSVSMLVRRDLAQGLQGLDDLLEPVAAGLDFSQRVRLAGGRVITVPSSEVFHQGRCREAGRGWREQAGRMRAMLKAYRPITLAWVIPYQLFVGVVDSLFNLVLLRWRPAAKHVASWGWNLVHLPSTIAARRKFKPVRAFGDEELFRFQARGSVRLRDLGAELTERLLFMFDDDKALSRGTKRIWSSPGIWGAVIAAALAVVAMRSIIFTGVPNAGFSFDFEPPSVALSRFFGGWNDSGLGSPGAVHPSTGMTGLASVVWFGAEGAARLLITVGAAFMAVLGMGRLSGRLGLRGPGRYLSGLVLLAGPGAAVLVGAGSWLGLVAASLLPWAVRSVFVHPNDGEGKPLSRFAWVIAWSLLLGAMSPVLVVVPLITVLLARALGDDRSRMWLAAAGLVGILVALPFLFGDPGWLTDANRRLGLGVDSSWPFLLIIGVVPLLFLDNRIGRLALTGGILSLASLVLLDVPVGGPGYEEALLIISSFGAAIVVASALDRLSLEPKRVLPAAAAIAVLILSVGSMADGRLGLPSGDINGKYGFAATLAGDEGPGRILVLSEDRAMIPGETRSGPGLWYRLIDGSRMTQDEAWLPEPLPGDEKLSAAIDQMASGADLRPGASLAEFSIDWVVIEGPETYLDQVLAVQLDLVPTPLDPTARIYGNPNSMAMASGSATTWSRVGTGFGGDITSARIRLSINADPRWSPDPRAADWAVSVAGDQGSGRYRPDPTGLALSIVSFALLVAAFAAVVVGRLRR